MTRPLSDAERKRKERAIADAGYVRIPMFIHRAVIRRLVEGGYLAEADASNKELVGALLGQALADHFEMLDHGLLD